MARIIRRCWCDEVHSTSGPRFAIHPRDSLRATEIEQRMSNVVARGAAVPSGLATGVLSDFHTPERILAERERDRLEPILP